MKNLKKGVIIIIYFYILNGAILSCSSPAANDEKIKSIVNEIQPPVTENSGEPFLYTDKKRVGLFVLD